MIRESRLKERTMAFDVGQTFCSRFGTSRNGIWTRVGILAFSVVLGSAARIGQCETIVTKLPETKTSEALLAPLVTGQNQKTFDADFKKLYEDATKGTADDKSLTSELFVKKAKEQGDNPELRRCLLLRALQLSQASKAPFRTQEKIYLDLLPL